MSFGRNSRLGFTIVELLVAATITVIIVVMLATMFGSLMKTSMRSNQRTDAFREGRAALQMIERDLSAVAQATPAAYFTATTATAIYADPNPATQKNHQLYALIALKNAGTGDLCAIGYYCRWDGTGYGLRRYFRNSNELMADAVYFTNSSRSVPPWNIRANGAGVYMPATKLYQPSDTDAPTANPPTFKDELLASNVWNLQIIAYKADGTVDTNYPTNPLLVTDPSAPAATLPVAIEISFNSMSSEAARTIRSLSTNPDDWMNPMATNNQRLVAPNAYEFRTRITF
jgi:Tfp pilus assembly protein PilV